MTNRKLVMVDGKIIKDINKKTIKEWDIVKRYCCNECKNYWVGVIIWRSDMGLVFRDYQNKQDTPVLMFGADEKPTRLEIIGDIAKDPSILDLICDEDFVKWAQKWTKELEDKNKHE